MDDTDELDTALPTYAVLAQLSRPAGGSGEDVVRAVEADLRAADAPYDLVTVERQDDDGTWRLRARFVVVSIDPHTAVAGVHETLVGAGVHPDEVWLDHVEPEPDPLG